MSEAYGCVCRWVTAVFPLGFREEGRLPLFWDLWQQYVITAVLFMAACFSYFPVSLFLSPTEDSAVAKGSVLVIHHLKMPVNKLYEWMIHSGTKCKQILCKLLSVFMFLNFLFQFPARFPLYTQDSSGCSSYMKKKLQLQQANQLVLTESFLFTVH